MQWSRQSKQCTSCFFFFHVLPWCYHDWCVFFPSPCLFCAPELPYGWEKIEDPQFGTYFVEWVNSSLFLEIPGGLQLWSGKDGEEMTHSKSDSCVELPKLFNFTKIDWSQLAFSHYLQLKALLLNHWCWTVQCGVNLVDKVIVICYVTVQAGYTKQLCEKWLCLCMHKRRWCEEKR